MLCCLRLRQAGVGCRKDPAKKCDHCVSGEKHDDRLGAGEHDSLVGAEVRLFTAANANANATATASLHSRPARGNHLGQGTAH